MFDPACGSGNFLTESYLSLRRLENDILRETVMSKSGTGVLAFDFDETDDAGFICVTIGQFYGIEIQDFACAVAKTALWIAESQMARETEDILHREMSFLPLTTNTNLHEANALRVDWKTILPPADDVKILGNPPFVGYSLQSKEQKADMLATYVDETGKPYKKAGKIDYVAGWYFKAAQYLAGTKIHAAFVSTNSITQGEQVADIWEPLYERFGIHIDFAYRTFRWDSESTQKAHVHVVIVGFSADETSAMNDAKKFIDSGGVRKAAKNINPYLADAPTIFIDDRKTPLCDVPELVKGSSPVDGQNLLLTEEEYEAFQKKEPGALPYIFPFLGAKEFLHDVKRYCFWLPDAEPGAIAKLPMLKARIEKTRAFRNSSTKKATQKYADYPTIFMENRQPKTNYILVPRHTSENRRYVPMGFFPPTVICGDANSAIPDATLYHFGILESNVHMAWMRTVAGRLKSDYRYSNTVVYNNFPWPAPTSAQRAEIERTAQSILEARAAHPTSSLAALYDDVFMPKDLREAHRANDRAVLRAYGLPVTITESDCVAELMRRYEQLVAKQQ